MLTITREQLLKNQAFVNRHRQYVQHLTTNQVCMIALDVLEPEIDDRAHALTPMETAALQLHFQMGVRAGLEFFMRFCEAKYDPHRNEPLVEDLEPNA